MMRVRSMAERCASPGGRWLVVAGAVVIQLCLGAIYAWSVFTTMLRADLADGGYGFTATQTQWVFSVGLIAFALVMLFAGRWQAWVGPRAVAAAGGIVLGLGYILGGALGNSFWWQLVCIGIVGGAGIGLAYVVPIAVGVKWFPEKKGMITGLAVAGFGFGATIWVKLAGSWFGGLLNTITVFGLPSVQSVFLMYGIVFLVLVCLGSLVMVNPPEGWSPGGGEAAVTNVASGPVPAQDGVREAVNLTTGQMIGTPQYWGLLLMFSASAMAGLMIIGVIRLFGVDRLVGSGAAPDAATAGIAAGTAMAWLAIANGVGRIAWGAISDKIGRKAALVSVCLSQSLMLMAFFEIGASRFGLIAGALVIGFNFGGNFALFPAATADFFGSKNLGSNYPWVFLAYGIAGLLGPRIAAYFKDLGPGVEAWRTPFLIAGLACLAAAGIGVSLRRPGAIVGPRPRLRVAGPVLRG